MWPPLRRGGFFLWADLDPAVPLDSVALAEVGGHVVPVLVALAAAVEQSVVPVPLVVVEEVVEPR